MKTHQQHLMIILTAAFYFLATTVNAQNNIAENDKNSNATSSYNINNSNCAEHKKEHQLTYEEFINHYGVDDTCVAIIDIYFDKRENSAAGRISMLPAATAVVLINAPIGVSLMIISTPIALSGTYTRIKYNRKNLIKTLVNYQTSNILTANLKNKVVTYLTIKEELRQEEMETTPQLANIGLKNY